MALTASEDEISAAEIEVLSGFLSRVKGGDIPNVEALDGFLTAIVISPDLVKPSEFTEVITKGRAEDGDLVFDTTEEAQRFFGLLMGHWNRINRVFRSGDVYLPLLLEDEQGVTKGGDWARGFLRGTHLRYHDWAEIAESDEHGGPFVYLWSLAYEDHPDPELRPRKTAFTEEERENLLVRMIAGTKQLYDHFQMRRSTPPANLHQGAPWADPLAVTMSRPASPRIGRNDPCPCGSGKKYKKCCGATTLH